jgi:HAMP domain-containing protein
MSSSHQSQEGASPESIASGFELGDWKWRPVIILVAATFITLLVAYLAMAALVAISRSGLADSSHELTTQDPALLPPGPLIEQNPNAEGDRMLATAHEQLESYGWVDRRARLTHIPIDRAKELLLEQGVNPFATD